MANEVKMKWVNHASYTLKYKNTHLIADPWLFGPSFDDGWDLLVKSKFTIQDFENITHIWFSHEHPDHFAPPVISQIPEIIRKGITVLFQKTSDKRVIKFCSKLSFKVIELPHRERYLLDDGFSIICGKMHGIDSWLLCEIDGLRILNLNDCVINKPRLNESIKRTTGEVDILMTQFSYANWVGNPEDKKLREETAKETLSRVKMQIETFKPIYTIPFASFVYFSHEENRYMNDSINTVEVAHKFINKETDSKSLVFYPEDEWDCISSYSSESALEKYKTVYDQIDDMPYRQPLEPLAESELMVVSEKYLKDIKKNNSVFAMRLLQLLPSRFGFKTILIRLMDTGAYCSFDWSDGLTLLPVVNRREDITLSTHSLKQIFQFPWGIGSILVNGRYRASATGSEKVSRIFMLGLWNSFGRTLSIGTLASKVMAIILGKNISTELEYSFYKCWTEWLTRRVS